MISLKKLLTEVKLNDAEMGASLIFVTSGIKSNYDNDVVAAKYGKEAVAKAKEMGPKVTQLHKKIQNFKKEIESSKEGQLLIQMLRDRGSWGGVNYSNADVTDIFKLDRLK